jgi:hypothetical protein
VSSENAMAHARVHRLVGQLRELLNRVTPGPWRVLPCDNGFAIAGGIVKYDRDDAGDTNGSIGSRANAEAIVAAVNAMDALLTIAEAAQAVADEQGHLENCRAICGPPGEQWIEESRCDCPMPRLASALYLLPNAKVDPAGVPSASQS